MSICLLVSALNSVDFPTFGSPTIPIDNDIEYYGIISFIYRQCIMENLLHKFEDVPRDELDKLTTSKKVIVFDLDGTLTESKADLDDEMAGLLRDLLKVKLVAVIGGGKYGIFRDQFIARLKIPTELLKKLYIFPASGTAFYRYENGEWKQVYAHELSQDERGRIFNAFKEVFEELHYLQPEKVYGEVIEDRGTQITFSALGQEAPLDLKKKWKEENTELKLQMADLLRNKLPSMSIGAAGFTSIDVTRKGIDKEYGVKQIQKYLNVSIENMIFVGDSLFPGGNDSAALRTGILGLAVNSVNDTKTLIRRILN
jgi:phosphomannomutase